MHIPLHLLLSPFSGSSHTSMMSAQEDSIFPDDVICVSSTHLPVVHTQQLIGRLHFPLNLPLVKGDNICTKAQALAMFCATPKVQLQQLCHHPPTQLVNMTNPPPMDSDLTCCCYNSKTSTIQCHLKWQCKHRQ